MHSSRVNRNVRHHSKPYVCPNTFKKIMTPDGCVYIDTEVISDAQLKQLDTCPRVLLTRVKDNEDEEDVREDVSEMKRFVSGNEDNIDELVSGRPQDNNTPEINEFVISTDIRSPEFDNLVNSDALDYLVVAIHIPTGIQYEFRRFRELLGIKAQNAKPPGTRFYVCKDRHNLNDCTLSWPKAQSFKEHIEKFEWEFVCISMYDNGSSCFLRFKYASGVRKHLRCKH